MTPFENDEEVYFKPVYRNGHLQVKCFKTNEQRRMFCAYVFMTSSTFMQVGTTFTHVH